jgi:ADP-ribose pyrophosphatase YjhB (NUDIX family)
MDWRKASASASDGACVEVATPDPSTVLVRNSHHPHRGTLALPAAAVATFVAACAAGEHDDLTA